MTPLARFIERLDSQQPNGDGCKARCPAHEDRNPSLLVRADDQGVVQFKCLAGCDHKSVLDALGIRESELHPDHERRNGHHKASTDIVADVARAKRMPLASFLAFGATVAVRGRATVARVPMFGADRQQCSEFDLGFGNPGLEKGLNAKGKSPGLFVANWPKPGDVVLVAEGVKDSSALHGLGFIAVGLPTCVMAIQFAKVFAGCNVVVVPDRDKAGQHGAKVTASRLFGIAASVRVATLPAEFKQSGGDGVREVLTKQGGEKVLREAIDAATEWQPEPEPADERIPIRVTPLEWLVTNEAIAALATDPNIYSRSGELVQAVVDDIPDDDIRRPEGTTQIRPVLAPILRERLGMVAKFLTVRRTDDGEQLKQTPPPAWCLASISHRGTWKGVRSLRAVVTSPTLRRDGSIVTTPGYDKASGLLYLPSLPSQFPLIAKPTRDDAQRAVMRLLDIVSDFPFASEGHKSAWLAALLTTFARHAFDGPAPMFLIDSNTRGSGKSLLSDLIGIIGTGKPMSRMSNPRDDDECRKRITSLAIAGDSLVLIDNIVGSLGCASLDAALTSTSWKDRILGKSEIVDIPLNVTWLATGNNVILAADTSRRVCHIRLESLEERPEERDGFKQPNLLCHVREHRPELVAAALTILSGYCEAGRPDQKLKPWGSFDGWSRLVCNAVVWVGLPDPGSTRRELVERSDVQAGALRTLITGWESIDPDNLGLLTSEILQRLDSANFQCAELKDAILELCGGAGKLLNVRTLGNKLRHLRGRVVGGKSLNCQPSRTRSMVWSVVAVEKQSEQRPETDSADSGDWGEV